VRTQPTHRPASPSIDAATRRNGGGNPGATRITAQSRRTRYVRPPTPSARFSAVLCAGCSCGASFSSAPPTGVGLGTPSAAGHAQGRLRLPAPLKGPCGRANARPSVRRGARHGAVLGRPGPGSLRPGGPRRGRAPTWRRLQCRRGGRAAVRRCTAAQRRGRRRWRADAAGRRRRRRRRLPPGGADAAPVAAGAAAAAADRHLGRRQRAAAARAVHLLLPDGGVPNVPREQFLQPVGQQDVRALPCRVPAAPLPGRPEPPAALLPRDVPGTRARPAWPRPEGGGGGRWR